MSGLLCAGDVYIDRLTDAGASTGLRKIGNATLLSLQETTERVQRISRGRDTYGQALDSVEIKQPTVLGLNLDEIDRENLAFALLGEAVTSTTAGISVTDEAVVAEHDTPVELAGFNLSASPAPVVTSDDGVTTYVGDTDYTINLVAGTITALSTGSITDSEDLLVSYTHTGVRDAEVTAHLDRWVELPHRDLSGVVVTNDTGSTTYVAGTDYELNARLGWIRPIPGGAITDASELLVDYVFAVGATVSKVAGATKPTIRCRIVLDGKNLANGDQIIVTVDETTLTPTSAVDFLSGEFTTLEMTGAPKTLPGKDSPYAVELKAAA